MRFFFILEWMGDLDFLLIAMADAPEGLMMDGEARRRGNVIHEEVKETEMKYKGTNR